MAQGTVTFPTEFEAEKFIWPIGKIRRAER